MISSLDPLLPLLPPAPAWEDPELIECNREAPRAGDIAYDTAKAALAVLSVVEPREV